MEVTNQKQFVLSYALLMYMVGVVLLITLIPVFRKLAIRLHGMDIPNDRKPIPCPRTVGIAMTLGICVSVLLWANGDQLVRAVLLGTDREIAD